MSSHAYLPPSGAAAWVYCNAWPLYNMMYPQAPTEDSEEGQRAHAEASTSLKSYQSQEGEIYISADLDVMLYVHCVLKVVELCGGLRKLHVEEPTGIAEIHPEMFGTPDAWLFDEGAGILHVFDFKFGYELVDVFENWQLICYAVGVMPEILTRDTLRVKFHIVQPRAFHPDGPVRTWEVMGTSLRPFVNQLVYAAGMAYGNAPQAVPGSHCLNCTGRHTCTAVQRWSGVAREFATTPNFIEMTPEQIGNEMTALKIASDALEARYTGLHAQAEALALNGQQVQGWAMEDTPGRLNWTHNEDDVYALGDMLGLNLRVTKPCTPTQAIGAGIDESVIHAYSTRSTSRKLKPVDMNKLRQIFNK